MEGTKDITTDTQKVAEVRPDHRFMMVDPITKALVYSELEQLGATVGSSDQVFITTSTQI